MKRSPLVLAVAAAMLLAGCGSSGDNGNNAGTKATASPTPAALTEAQLKAALVTKADLPAGYEVDASAEEDDSDIKTKAATPECQAKYDVLDQLEDDESAVSAEADFAKDEGETTLSQSWEVVDDPIADISKDLATIKSAVTECPQVQLTEADGSDPLALTFSAFSLDGIGDESFGMLATNTEQGFAIAFGFVRVGTNMQFIEQGGAGDPDLTLVRKVAQLGVDRLPKA
jgi:hypothetical protein